MAVMLVLAYEKRFETVVETSPVSTVTGTFRPKPPGARHVRDLHARRPAMQQQTQGEQEEGAKEFALTCKP